MKNEKLNLILVDAQNHFIKNNQLDFTEDVKKIKEHIKKNYKKLGEIIMVVDEIDDFSEESRTNLYDEFHGEIFDYLRKDIKEEEYDNEEEYQDTIDTELGHFMDRNNNLLEMNVDLELIVILDKLLINGIISSNSLRIIKKEYGTLRNLMAKDIDVMIYILELKHEIEKINNNYSCDFEDIPENQLTKEILIKLDKTHTEEEITDLLELCNFNVNDLDSEYLNELNKNKEYTICGGGAMECLMEEYIKIISSQRNYKVDTEVSLTYGDSYGFEKAIDSLEEQVETIKEIKKNINKENKKSTKSSFKKM